ncbi:UbiA family prenyltransferase [Antarcticimicrobium sediminis]|nr:UbiA family prenyltransferase [Antarcticimicrobium sediminis]
MTEPTQTESPDTTPLILDVDGTLLRTDMLYESLWAAAGRNIAATLKTCVTQWRAPNLLKHALCEIAAPNVALLPLRPAVLDLADAARQAGRAVHLASGSDQALVEAVAQRLDLPGPHFGSDATRNLTEQSKAQMLVERFGEGGFDYVGNSNADLPVWSKARRIIAVSPGGTLRHRLEAMGKPLEVVEDRSDPFALLREMRPHQWIKNLLLFLPLLVAHEFGLSVFLAALMAAAAFSIGASAIYILNDLLDLESDRLHPEKRNRPIASGALQIRNAMIASAGLVVLALTSAWLVGPPVAALTLLYMLTSLTYSFWLKKRRWIDLASLAFMFLLRVLTGAVAAQIAVPGVVMAFVFVVFFTLACVKRMTALARDVDHGKLPGRGYGADDFRALKVLAAAGIVLSAAAFLLYAFSGHSGGLYGSQMIFAATVLPLTLWLFRVVRLSELGREDYDPIQFVTHDRIGLMIMVIGVALVILSL